MWYTRDMRIIGIDPGIATTGFGIIEKTGNKFAVLEYGAILTPAGQPLPKRLGILSNELRQLLSAFTPAVMAVEELFFNKNVKTAITVAHARGAILLNAETHGIPIIGYTPPQVKMAVSGYGKADKKQMQQMVKSLLNLNEVPKPDDVADALAVAICHAHSHKIHSLA